MDWSLDKTVAVDFDNRRYFDTSNDGKYISFLNTSNTFKVYNTITGEDMGWDIPNCYFLGFKIINSPDSLGGTFLVAIKAGYIESDDTGIIREETDSIIFYKLESGTWVEKGSYQQTTTGGGAIRQEKFQIEILYFKEDGGVLSGRLAWDFEFSEVRHRHVGASNPIHISEGVNKYLFMVIPSAGNQNPSSGNRHAGSTIFTINTVDGTITKKALLKRGWLPLPNNEILTQEWTSDFYILDLNKALDIDFDDYVFENLDGGKNITESVMHVKTLTIDTIALGADHILNHLKPFAHARMYQNPSGNYKILGLYKKWVSPLYELGLYSIDYDPVEKTLIANDHMILGSGKISSPNVRLFFPGETSSLTQISLPLQWDQNFWDQEPPQFADSSHLNKTIHIDDEGKLYEVTELQKGFPSILLPEPTGWIQIGQDIDGEASSDQSGYSTAINSAGDIVAIASPNNDSNGANTGFVRIYQNVNKTWTQIGQDIYGEAEGDFSGYSLSFNSLGNIVAIGSGYNDGNGENSGHVRVYQYQSASDTWTQIGQDIDGEASYNWSGNSVSLNSDGNIVAIGAARNDGNGENSGHVRVYQNIDGAWEQIGQDIDGKASSDFSGASVSLNSEGNIVAIGAPGAEDVGHVRVYQYQSASDAWTQIGDDIDGEALNDANGKSVSLNSKGNIVAIGAWQNADNGDESGHVRVYQRMNIDGPWEQIGQDIDGEGWGGWSVSLNSLGNIVAVASPTSDENGQNSGSVRIYENNNGTWTQIAEAIIGEASNDQSGYSISLNSHGNIVAIGAPYNDDNGENSGHVRVFNLLPEPTRWIQIGQIEGEYSLDNSGHSVSVNSAGDIVAIGAPYNEDNRTESAFKGHGHVRVYRNIDGIWAQIGQDINGEAYGDDSGWSTSINSAGDIVAIGAIKNHGMLDGEYNGNDSGHVRVYQYQSASDAWIQIGQDIDGEVAYDNSGHSVSVNSAGDIVAIGSRLNGDDWDMTGHVRVYQYQSASDTWAQIGQDIDGEASGDQSGYSTSLNSDGTIVAIGAPRNDDNGESSGHVRVYQYQSTSDTWIQIGQDIDGEAGGVRSGWSTSLNSDGTIVAIGAIYASHVRVYQYQSTSDTWTQIGQDIDGIKMEPVSINSAGNIVVIGSPNASPNDLRNSGLVLVYQYQNASDTWEQIGQDINGEAYGDNNGYSVSINSAGDIIAIGASSNDNSGTYAGYTRIFKLLPEPV